MNELTKEEAEHFLSTFIDEYNKQDNAGTAAVFYIELQTKRYHLVTADVDFDESGKASDLISDWEEYGFKASEEVYKKNYWHTENIFFTWKGAKQHVKLNRHNYTEWRFYVKHAFRNPEIDNLLAACAVMVGKKVERR